MKLSDLLTMSVNNLKRRKLRTVLTVLGVMIGTASIVVMVSLGIGLKEMTVEQYASFGSLTRIEVNSDYGWNSDVSEDSYLNDEKLELFAQIPNVTHVCPVLSTYITMKQGVYTCGTRLQGVSRQVLEEIELAEGTIPASDSSNMELVIGNLVQRDFYHSKTGAGYWETGEEPDVDLLNEPFFVTFQNSGTSGKQKKYMFPAVGLVAGGLDNYNDYSYGVYTDIDLLEKMLRQIYKKSVIPGQPTNKKGKPLSFLVYDTVYVYVDEMDNVVEVQKQITDMGYYAYSSMEWLEQAQEQTDMIQAALGGIGAVSMFVAAISIANTMMMSIYERTKEIGVLKVLGCGLGTIRNMFLIEAGFIGFMGGTIGLGLSYGISYLVNNFLNLSMMGGSGDISRIPPWLAMLGLAFAVGVGMLAGLFPALRAMKLSPLAAIRNE